MFSKCSFVIIWFSESSSSNAVVVIIITIIMQLKGSKLGIIPVV